MVYTPTDTDNYDYSNVVLEQNVSVTVKKATPPTIDWPTASDITYGDALSASRLNSQDTNGSFAWKKLDMKPNAGQGSFTVVYMPTDTDNYDYSNVVLERNVSVTVKKARAPTIDWPTASEITYGDVLSASRLNSQDANGRFAWKNPDMKPNAGQGSFTVIYTPTDSENYDYSNVALEQNVSVTVNKATAPAIIWPSADTITFGQSLGDSALTSSDEHGSFAWKKSDTKPNAGQGSFTVVYTPADTENYDYSGTTFEKEISVTVIPATAPTIQWPTASDITYGDSLSASRLTSGDTNGTFAWKNLDEKPNAGTRSCVVVYTPNNASDYGYDNATLEKGIPVKVNKAKAIIDVSKVPTQYTYTGARQTVTGAMLNHGECALVYINNTFTTVAEGDGLTVEITAAETANYLPAKVTLTIEVDKADAPDFRLPAASKITYGQKLSESALSGDGPGSFAWEDGSILPPAGLNTYNVVLTPDDRDNYNWPQEKLVQAIEIIVDKKYVRLTIENAYKSYGDVDPAAKVSVLGTLEGDSLDYSISRKAGENVGQYAYIVSEGSNPNYTLDMLLGTLTIQPRDIAADKISVSAVGDQIDTGFAICPEPTVTFGGVVLVPGRDYALSYSNNIGPGRATITITGQGNFSGSRELSFTINPKPTAAPTATPTVAPTATPTATPTVAPTATPTATSTAAPTAAPTAKPTARPTVKPTAAPSFVAIQNDALQEYLNSLMLLVFDAEYAPVGYAKIPVLVSDEESEERILLISESQEEGGEPAQRSLMLDAAQLIRLAQLMQEDEDGELTSDLLFENGGVAARVRIAELTGGKMAKLMTLLLSGEEITDELLQIDWSALEDAALTEAEYKRFSLEVRIAPVIREDGRQGSEISVWLCHGDAKLNVSVLLETLCVTLNVDHLVTNGNADTFENLYAIAREFEDEIELLDSTLVLAPSIPAELIAREVDDAAEKGTPTLAERYVLSASYAGEGMYWVVATDLR